MAVTIDVDALRRELRVGDSADETALLAARLAYATEAVTHRAPSAPDTIHNEAAIVLAARLYDRPTAGIGTRYAYAGRDSGAWAMLAPYRIHRAGLTGQAAVDAANADGMGNVGNPVTNVAFADSTLTVSFADGSTQTYTIVSGDGEGTPGVDQTARAGVATNAAAIVVNADGVAVNTAGVATNAATQATHAADPNAHHVPTTPGGDAVSESARLPVGTVAMRLGWAQSQTPTDAIFTRANNHPTDGAAVGTVAGLNPPVFPPALNTDTTLYLFVWIATAQANIADIRLSGGGGTLIGSLSNGAAYSFDGMAGTIYVSNQRLSAGLAAFQISAVVGGDLIASQPWVTEQIAAIPAASGGAPVLIGEKTVLTGTPVSLLLDTADSDTFIAAFNAGTYPGGYRFVVSWAVGSITNVINKDIPADIVPTLATATNTYIHLSAYAALEESGIGRYVGLSRVGTDRVELVSLPSTEDLVTGLVFKVWGLP